MIILGVDPGTATTGYGLVLEDDQGSLKVIEFGVIQTPPEQPMSQRLLDLNRQLQDIILLHHPQCGAVEKLFFQRNVRTAISVGQARGVILFTCAQMGLEVAEYTPLEVKLAVVGYGNAEKNQVQQMVRAILGLDDIPRPDDAADALAIAICHLHSAKMRSLLIEE